MKKHDEDVLLDGKFFVHRVDGSSNLDWLQLADLQRAGYAEEWPNTDHIDRMVRAARLQRAGVPPSAATWLALDRYDEGAGTVRITTQGQGAYLVLYVSPRSRGNGVGRFLLRTAIQHARKAGVGTLVSWTTSSIPQGEKFAEFFRGHTTNREWSMQVSRDDLDCVALRKWKDAVKNEIKFDVTCNPCSAEHAESILNLRMMISAAYGFNSPG